MPTADIYLLGSGIRGALQFSRETIQALGACRKVFVLHDDLSVHDYVRTLCPDVHDLADLYSEDAIRSDIYRSISQLLVAEAKENGPSIGFLVHGHPLFLVSATEYTLEHARDNDLHVEMLASVSSFDTILCDLEIDYGYGLQIFDSSTMISREWQPNPRVPALVFQLSTTLNNRVVTGEPSMEVLSPLMNFLLSTYPAHHEVRIVHSSAHLLEKSSIIDLRLDKLATDERIELWKRPTLYVPPVD